MEEFVFDSVNDYYAYMLDYFRNTEKAFPLQNGYNLAIWNIYLKDVFGFWHFKKTMGIDANAVRIKLY